MDVAHQFKQIGIFLTQDRFVPILKQVAMSVVASAEADGMAGQKPTHHGGNGGAAGSQQQMKWLGSSAHA